MHRTIQEFLQATGPALIVPDEEELIVDPTTEQFAHVAHRLEIQAFDDLQALQLIPNTLSERGVREAIQVDDEEALALARSSLVRHPEPCTCTEGVIQSLSTPSRHTYGSELRSTYKTIRRSQHRELARVMSSETGSEVSWNSLHVSIVHRWVDRLSLQVLPSVFALLFADVEIMKNSTLTLTPSAKLLTAGALKIHVGGKLKVQGSSIKILCKSAQGNLP